MKKIISFVTCILILLFTSVIYATTTFTATLQSDKSILKAGDEVNLVLKLENFTENENGINILLANINYDKSIFEKVEQKDISTIQYWEAPTFNPDKGKLILETYTFVNETHNVLKIKLKVKESISETKMTEVKLSGIVASDGESDIKVDDAIVSLEVEKSNEVVSDTEKATSYKAVYTILIIFAIIVLGSIIIVLIKKKM